PPEAPYNVFPYLFLIYITLTSGWFLWQKSRFPGITRSMRRGMEEIQEQFATPEKVTIPSISGGQLPSQPTRIYQNKD
ncbi:MAG: APC family permease, partial [Waterburya sp.]